MLRGLQMVFGKCSRVGSALLIALVILALAIWFPNIALIGTVLGSADITLVDKVGVLTALLGSFTTNFTVVSASYTLAIAVLFGMNVVMVVYLLRRNAALVAKGGTVTGFLGLVSGIFGIGCAACGSFILTSVLALFGVSGVLAFLPFGGEEFGFLAVALLLVSVGIAAKQISSPLVCNSST
jgi:hypothetical protein